MTWFSHKMGWIVVALAVFLSIWSARWVYITAPDSAHLRNRFDHSQWRMPLSERVIPDGELYLVAGVDLVKNGAFFEINPEVPPLAKYFYGWTQVITGNAYYASLGFYLGFLLVSYAILSLFTQSALTKQLALFLLITSPLFSSQLEQTMLDLPQLFFLSLHAYFMIKILIPRNTSLVSRQLLSQTWLLSVAAGLSLGAFSACKVPLLTPVILVIDGLFLVAHRQWRSLLLISGSMVVGYVGVFSHYFMQGHTPMEWLAAQKWMIQFYRGSQTYQFVGSYWVSTLIGWHRDSMHPTGIRTLEWTVTWPVALVTLIVGGISALLQSMKNKKVFGLFTSHTYLGAVAGSLSVLYTVVPFSPRYFLLILPFAVYYGVIWWEQKNLQSLSKNRSAKYVLAASLCLLLVTTSTQWIVFTRTQPEVRLSYAAEDWTKGNYDDFYSYLEADSIAVDRSRFHALHKELESDFEYYLYSSTRNHSLILSFETVPIWKNTARVTAERTWVTLNGLQTDTISLTAVRKHNQWYLEWNPELFWPGVDSAKFSQGQTKQAVPPSAFTLPAQSITTNPAWEVRVVSSQLQHPDKTLTDLAELYDTSYMRMQKRIYTQGHPSFPVAVGFLSKEPTPDQLNWLKNTPGVVYRETFATTPEKY